jgi:hypothetical protein
MLVNTLRFMERAVPANGVVVEIAREVDVGVRQSGEEYYFPVVEFVTARGQVVRFQANESTNSPGEMMGDEVGILYDPANPRDARLDTGFSVWGGAAVFGGIGLCFVIISGSFLLRRRAAQRGAGGN